ncbi:MAG: hypothetical protein WDN29_16440 [Methylovirgula sp.]
MRAPLLALMLVVAGAMPAAACNAIADGPGSSCAQWANITGDVEQDRCPIAKAGVERAEESYAQSQEALQPGQPVWSQAFVLALLNEARGRVARYCGNSAASLP